MQPFKRLPGAFRQETRWVGLEVGVSRRAGRRPEAANNDVVLFRQARMFGQSAARVPWPWAP